MSEVTTIPLRLAGNLSTNTSGIRNLLKWYQTASAYRECGVYTCCKELEWLDANLSALWSALIFKLKVENRLYFTMDEANLSGRLSILQRNGFSKPTMTMPTPADSFIRNACFGPDDEARFSQYIKGEMMQQTGLQRLSDELRGLLEWALEELRSNVFRHAQTEHPFFVCGQYYPKLDQLKISLADIGVSFLPPIQQYTGGVITSQADAIRWAVNGKDEKLGNGGLALKSLKAHFDEHGHQLQIISGDTFWDSGAVGSGMGPFRSLFTEMPGTVINLLFNKISG